MAFDPISEPIDYVLLANQRSPGLADLSNVSSPRRWDERKGYALSGSRVVYRGIGLARPLLTLRLYTAEDFAAWHEWRPLLDRPAVGTRPRQALDIWHPILEDNGITKVVVEDVLGARQTADGEWSIDIKLIEFRLPVRTLESVGSSEERPVEGVDLAIQNLQGIIENNGIGSISNALSPLNSL